MVSGKKAFEGKSQAHLIAAIITVDPDPLSKLQPVPPALHFLVTRCLVKDPEERLQSMSDVLDSSDGLPKAGRRRARRLRARLAAGDGCRGSRLAPQWCSPGRSRRRLCSP